MKQTEAVSRTSHTWSESYAHDKVDSFTITQKLNGIESVSTPWFNVKDIFYKYNFSQ
jgi:hypothetical protein